MSPLPVYLDHDIAGCKPASSAGDRRVHPRWPRHARPPARSTAASVRGQVVDRQAKLAGVASALAGAVLRHLRGRLLIRPQSRSASWADRCEGCQAGSSDQGCPGCCICSELKSSTLCPSSWSITSPLFTPAWAPASQASLRHQRARSFFRLKNCEFSGVTLSC